MFVKSFDHLIELAKKMESKTIVVVKPEDEDLLEVISKAEIEGLANFILVGDKEKLISLINENNIQIDSEIVNEKDEKTAADKAVDLIVDGKADALMKGMLHSSIFLKAILNKEKGLNIGKQITQISVLEKENNKGFLFITDCAITVNPDLMGKKEIIENAVNLANKLGNYEPKVAVLASVEVVNPSMQETIDAAVLSKMADRGQIKGCLVDGPLAFDNAISEEAAKAKGVGGDVAGKADIIVVPSLTVGNTLTKSITYIAKKTVVAATTGAAIPIIFTSRTESTEGKLLSIALAAYTA
ncbi:bifunctional enoyl-CoA hydratase/phosphate acetyltransferase [Gudongella sp. DL1XJH-153]|uniref:bifunctional enoyl-CoA hydratase/phosphate acetyltransferase n=1 Tax=Gudongella sp. DL1XJH-153 TaxID=3409804 RepID=UPI003BB65444